MSLRIMNMPKHWIDTDEKFSHLSYWQKKQYLELLHDKKMFENWKTDNDAIKKSNKKMLKSIEEELTWLYYKNVEPYIPPKTEDN